MLQHDYSSLARNGVPPSRCTRRCWWRARGAEPGAPATQKLFGQYLLDPGDRLVRGLLRGEAVGNDAVYRVFPDRLFVDLAVFGLRFGKRGDRLPQLLDGDCPMRILRSCQNVVSSSAGMAGSPRPSEASR